MTKLKRTKKLVTEKSNDRLGNQDPVPVPERPRWDLTALQKKQEEIDKLTAHVRKLEVETSFFSSSHMEQLVAFQLFESQDLSEKELGQLVGVFNGRFHYGLFVQYFYEKARHGWYRLHAIERQTDVGKWDAERRKKLPKEDELKMRSFIEGFVAAVKVMKVKS